MATAGTGARDGLGSGQEQCQLLPCCGSVPLELALSQALGARWAASPVCWPSVGLQQKSFPACSSSCEQTGAWSFVSKDKLSSLLVKEHLLTFTFHKTLSCSFFNHERWNWISSCYPCGITSVSSCVSMYLSIHFISANRFTICFIIAVPAFLPLIIFDKQMLLKELLLGQSSLACRLRWLLAAPTQRCVFVPRHN